jgi:hypothetical protein
MRFIDVFWTSSSRRQMSLNSSFAARGVEREIARRTLAPHEGLGADRAGFFRQPQIELPVKSRVAEEVIA